MLTEDGSLVVADDAEHIRVINRKNLEVSYINLKIDSSDNNPDDE